MQSWIENWRTAKFCDVANVILGAFLFFSPWIFGFNTGTVSQNAYISGIVIAVLAIEALAPFAIWEENLIVGLWTLVSPWVLGFQGTTAMTVHVIIGAAVAILAATEIMMSQIPPRLTAGRSIEQLQEARRVLIRISSKLPERRIPPLSGVNLERDYEAAGRAYAQHEEALFALLNELISARKTA
jgi:SPW repeat